MSLGRIIFFLAVLGGVYWFIFRKSPSASASSSVAGGGSGSPVTTPPPAQTSTADALAATQTTATTPAQETAARSPQSPATLFGGHGKAANVTPSVGIPARIQTGEANHRNHRFNA